MLSRFVDASGGKDTFVLEDMSDRTFQRRHRPFEKDEAEIREEERKDSIVRWAICDSNTCRKWRILPKHSSIPNDPSLHWYCGGLTSRHGGRPNPANCAKRDDWLVKCVGERLSRDLDTMGITTVALLEMKDGQHPPKFEEYCQKMRRLGVYYDATTQTICKY